MPKRPRGHRSRTVRRPPRRHARFEQIVDRVLASIPPPFAAALREVAVVIEDEPSVEQLREQGLPDDEWLYGLYEGVARTEWGADSVPFPNKITIYRLPLEEDFPDPDDLADEIEITVIHELAHHLGIDEDRLEELGYE
ncbi:MAG: metallopeptidase family protein [Chloroflexota bacterium]